MWASAARIFQKFIQFLFPVCGVSTAAQVVRCPSAEFLSGRGPFFDQNGVEGHVIGLSGCPVARRAAYHHHMVRGVAFFQKHGNAVLLGTGILSQCQIHMVQQTVLAPLFQYSVLVGAGNGMAKSMKNMMGMIKSMTLENILNMTGKKVPANAKDYINSLLTQIKK